MKQLTLLLMMYMFACGDAFSQKRKSHKKAPIKTIVKVPVANPVYAQDLYGRYEYVEGDPSMEFEVKRSDLRLFKFVRLTSKKDSVIVSAQEADFDSVFVLNKMPVYVSQGCTDTTCQKFKVRIVRIFNETKLMICRNGYIRFIEDGRGENKKSRELSIGGRQILYCPLRKAEEFLVKLEQLKPKPQ